MERRKHNKTSFYGLSAGKRSLWLCLAALVACSAGDQTPIPGRDIWVRLSEPPGIVHGYIDIEATARQVDIRVVVLQHADAGSQTPLALVDWTPLFNAAPGEEICALELPPGGLSDYRLELHSHCAQQQYCGYESGQGGLTVQLDPIKATIRADGGC